MYVYVCIHIWFPLLHATTTLGLYCCVLSCAGVYIYAISMYTDIFIYMYVYVYVYVYVYIYCYAYTCLIYKYV